MTTSPFWIHHRALENELAKERRRRIQIGLVAFVGIGICLTAAYFLFR